MKICTKCKLEKSLDEFHKDSKRKDRRRSHCRKCIKEYDAIQKPKYYKNPEVVIRKAEYVQTNPHIWWELGYKKRCDAYKLPIVIERFTLEDLIARDGDACVDCGADWESLDHVVPVIAGGPHTLDNCELVCDLCNHKRWNEYLAKLKIQQTAKLA